MGVDIAHKHKKKSARSAPNSRNIYLLLLVRLYRFLVRRTSSRFNELVLKRLYQSRVNQAPISLRKLHTLIKGKTDKTAVIVGTVTNDIRFLTVPKISVCALRFTEAARKRIVAAGGECITFDQLALRKPTGANTVLLRGRKTARKAFKHFGGAAGQPHVHVKPYTRKVGSMGKKHERARGRRKSCGFKV